MINLFNRIQFMRNLKWFLIAIVLIVLPMAASAEWLDFIGTAARAGADSYIHTIYINAVERQIVTIEFLLYAILATVQMVVAYLIVRNFRLSFTSANKDNVIKWLEGTLLGVQAFITLVLCIGLLWSSYYNTNVYVDGLNEIREFKGLEYSPEFEDRG